MTAAGTGKRTMNWDSYGGPDVAIEAISADESGQLFKRMHDGQVFVFDREADRWTDLKANPGPGRIAAGNGTCHRLLQSGAIEAYFPLYKAWLTLDTNANSHNIVPTGGFLYQRWNSGQIWQYTAPPLTGWKLLDQAKRSKEIVADAQVVYQRAHDGSILRLAGDPPIPYSAPGGQGDADWVLLDGPGPTVQIAVQGTILYKLDEHGAIFSRRGTIPDSWKPLGVDSDTVEIVADSTGLTRRGRSGALWSILNPEDQWTQVNDDPTTIEVTSGGGTIYQRHKDGRIEGLDFRKEI